MSIPPDFQEGDPVIIDNGSEPILKGMICGYTADNLWIVKLNNPISTEYKFSCMCFHEWMIKKDPDAPPKISLKETLAHVQRAYRIMSNRDYCPGLCKVWKHEGPRSYTEKAPLVNGQCSYCHKEPNPEIL
jgi:hypothetical protein